METRCESRGLDLRNEKEGRIALCNEKESPPPFTHVPVPAPLSRGFFLGAPSRPTPAIFFPPSRATFLMTQPSNLSPSATLWLSLKNWGSYPLKLRFLIEPQVR